MFFFSFEYIFYVLNKFNIIYIKIKILIIIKIYKFLKKLYNKIYKNQLSIINQLKNSLLIQENNLNLIIDTQIKYSLLHITFI